MGGGSDRHRDTLRSALLVGTQILSGVSRFRWQSVEAVWHGFQEVAKCILHLTLLGRARFIAWDTRRPFLGEYRRRLRHFWSRWGCLSNGPAPEPPKKALCHTHPIGGTFDKYWHRDTLRSTVFDGTRTWSGVSWFQWSRPSDMDSMSRAPRPASSNSRVPSPRF